MTTLAGSEPVITQALTARVFLLGDDGGALRDRLRQADLLEPGGPLGGAGGAVRRLVDDQLAPIAAGFLDVDLGAVAVAGWRLHDQLRTAAAETLATPGLTTVVELVAHRIESSWHPRVELVVASRPVAHVVFDLTVSFDVVGLTAAVTGGRLVGLGGGRCRVSASFAVAERTLAERTAQFDPGGVVPLGAGIPLAVVPKPAEAPDVVVVPAADGETPQVGRAGS